LPHSGQANPAWACDPYLALAKWKKSVSAFSYTWLIAEMRNRTNGVQLADLNAKEKGQLCA
jgi:hypothetical protein